MSIRAGIALFAACLCPAIALAGNGFWSSTGPYGGFTYRVVVDPATPSRIYATGRNGLFVSEDAGATWSRRENGLVGTSIWNFINPQNGDQYGPVLLLDADDPQRLYAFDATHRLARSADGGQNWFILPSLDIENGQEVATDMADVPGSANAGKLYVALTQGSSPSFGGLLYSDDFGESFTQLAGGLPAQAGYNAVAVDPDNPLLVMAAIGVTAPVAPTDPSIPGIWRSTDGGQTWAPSSPFPGTGSNQVSFDVAFGAGTTVYAVVGGGVIRSDDNGLTWPITPVFTDARTVMPHPTLPNTVYVGGGTGFRVSTDGGLSFAPSPASLSPNPSYTSTAPPNAPAPPLVRGIALDPGFPAPGTSIWVAIDGGGIARSTDGGLSFSPAGPGDGLTAVNVRAFALHPGTQFTNATRPIYAGFGDPGAVSSALFRSLNNGGSWPTANTGLKLAQIRGLALDPSTVGGVGSVEPAPSLGTAVVYAVGRSDVRLGINSGLRNSGIYKSNNGGASWFQLDGGLPRVGTPPTDAANINVVRAVLLDPRSCANPPPGGLPCGRDPATLGGQRPLQTVWAIANGVSTLNPVPASSHRVIRSTDGGLNWSSRDSGIPVVNADEQVLPIVLAMDPNDGNTLYLATTATRFNSSAPISTLPNPTIASGVFKTTDGGLNWAPANNGRPFYPGSTTTAHECLALAVHPSVSGTLWAARMQTAPDGSIVSAGLQKSIDGGANWFDVGAGLPPRTDLRVLIVDPVNPDVLYAGGGSNTASSPGAVYKSVDGGLTFRSISISLPSSSATALALDPSNPQVLLAGTDRGVWTLTQVPDADGDGAPDSNEGGAVNPGGGGSGDGNGDGIPDSTQGDVGSSIVLFAPEFSPLRRGDGTEAALRAAPQGDGASFTVDVLGNTCTRANDVSGVLASAQGRDFLTDETGRSYDYPQDLVQFELPACAQAQVDVIFPNATAGGRPDFTDAQWSFRIYGPSVPGDDTTIGWHDLSARAQRISGTRWRLSLDANQFGSYRPDDNAILFLGGPAFDDDRVFRNGFE